MVIEFLIFAIFLGLCLSCTREFSECESSTPLDAEKVMALRLLAGSSGPSASLLIPNPINATHSASILASDPQLLQASQVFRLPDLGGLILDNALLRVRIAGFDDDKATLAKPDADGSYHYRVGDVHYSEVLTYYLVTMAVKYFEALGFSVNRTRPLFALVRAKAEGSQDINAFYEPNFFDPKSPRTLRFIGDSNFPAAEDGDVIRHEMGHFLVSEASTHELGIDYRGEWGGRSEASGMHEGLADYFAASLSDDPNIGEWVARNFSGIRAGDPLRSTEDRKGDTPDFRSVVLADGTEKTPDKYKMGTWFSRALYDFREQILKEDPNLGAALSDRLVFSAVSLLSKNASFSEFRNALLAADSKLHCGLHRRSIEKAFESRGFKAKVPELSAPLLLEQVEAVGLSFDNQSYRVVSPAPGVELRFRFRLTNPNSEDARNVVVQLDPTKGFINITPQTAFGDLPPGKSISVGLNGGLSLDFSVVAIVDQIPQGRKISFTLTVSPENGPITQSRGELNL